MVDPISMSVVIGILMKSAPGWFQSLQETILSKGKEAALAKGKEKIQGFLDERKHLRHVELALQNAAERGLKQFHTLEERDRYRSLLQFLSESNSEALRHEAMQLFTLSDNPDLKVLMEKYNLRQRISALAHHEIYEDIDATLYLSSFFEALIAELYNDPLFRVQMSDVIKARAALKGQQSLEDIIAILGDIYSTLTNKYNVEQFQRDIDTYIKYVETKFRHHKFAGIVFKADEDKAPELDGIFVPLRILLRDQFISEAEMNDNIFFLLEQSSYLVLLGGPGSGKSTITRYLAWSHAKVNSKTEAIAPLLPLSKKSDLLSGKPVPLQIELRLLSEARKQNASYSFLTYATEVMLSREDISLHPQMFKELLERRAMLLLFDGLDEVATLAERQQLVSDIESFAQMYPGNRILVTSRPVGYDLASFADRLFQHSEVQDFNDEQIHQFLESWYTHVLKYSPLPSDIHLELETFYATLEQNERLHRLAANPLLLTVMTALHRYERLPDERALIYEKCADLLLDTWAKLKYENTRWKNMKMGKQDQVACLAHLGFVLHNRSQEAEISNTTVQGTERQSNQDNAVDVPASFMQREIKHFLATQNLLTGAEQNAEAESFLELVRFEAGLIVARGTDETGETLYGFVHRTFQEYFAAVDVFERYQQDDDSKIISDFLEEHLHEPHWREVILLLFGKLKHKFATAQLRRILEGKSRLSKFTEVVNQDLFFVCDCLAEGITVETNFAEQSVSQVSNLVRISTIPSQRHQALNALGKLLRTRQYADLGRQGLKAFVIDNTIVDISIKIEVARIFYEGSPAGSDEGREGARLLLALGQREALSLEQLIQVVQAIYEHSPAGSDEQQFALQVIQQIVLNQGASLKQRLGVAIVPLTVRQNNFTDRALAVRMILTLMQGEEVKNLLSQNWLPMPFSEERRQVRIEQTTPYYEALISEIPSVVDLVKQDVLPVEARDEMYQLLSDMVPLFGNVGATGN